jgi:hypothetical protein
MLGPFDWYTAIGIAAGVVGLVALVAWLTGQIGPPRK